MVTGASWMRSLGVAGPTFGTACGDRVRRDFNTLRLSRYTTVVNHDEERDGAGVAAGDGEYPDEDQHRRRLLTGEGQLGSHDDQQCGTIQLHREHARTTGPVGPQHP